MAWIFARRRASAGLKPIWRPKDVFTWALAGLWFGIVTRLQWRRGVPLATCLRNCPKQSWVYCWWVGSTARKILRLYDHRIPSGRTPSLGFQ
jgi:hypothetical protein